MCYVKLFLGALVIELSNTNYIGSFPKKEKKKKEKRKKLHWLVIVLIGCIFILYHFLFSYSTL